MACFWIALSRELKNIISLSPNDLMLYVKSHNTLTPNVRCMNKPITKQQQKENQERIKQINTISNGYLCSAFDPVLILLTELFNLCIIHHYANNIIAYTHTKQTKHIIELRSNRNHMS